MIRAAVFGLVNVVHAHGVGVLKPAGNDRFMLESLDEEFVAEELRGNHFQRPHFIKCQVQRLVDRTHATLPHFGQQAVFPANDTSIRPGSDFFQRTAIRRANGVIIWITSLACWAGLHVAPVDIHLCQSIPRAGKKNIDLLRPGTGCGIRATCTPQPRVQLYDDDELSSDGRRPH